MGNSMAASAVTSGLEGLRHTYGPDLGASVRNSEDGWGDGLRSPSARSSASQLELGCDVALRDPESLMRGLISCGVDKDDATKMVLGYYQAAVVSRTTSVVSSENSVAVSVTSKTRRLQAWRAEVATLPDGEGHCYLHVIRWARRKYFLRMLGSCPTMRSFVAMLEPGDLSENAAREYNVYQLPLRQGSVGVKYHIAKSYEEGELIGSVYAVVACLLRVYPFLNGQVQYADESVDILPLVGVVGAPASVHDSGHLPCVQAIELARLKADDLSVCFCSVHKQPLTYRTDFSDRGCCKKNAGKAPVIASAFNRVSRACHADESVRRQDARFLQMVLSDDDPGVLRGRVLPDRMAQLCTTQDGVTLVDFGNGYCYLTLLMHSSWWRVARLLGPNPMLADLVRVMRWVGRLATKLNMLLEVSSGFYHVLPVKQAKGVDHGAGLAIFQEMQQIIARCPNARIG